MTKTAIQNVSDFSEQIRGLLNKNLGCRFESLFETDHNKAIGSLDILNDTATALSDFKVLNWPDSIGHQYLLVYGCLQTLVVQQDSVFRLEEVFFKKHEDWSEDIKEIREIRNQSIGHSIESRKDQPFSTHLIGRINMNHKDFNYISYTGHDFSNYKIKRCTWDDLFERQNSALTKRLEKICEEIKRREREYRKLHHDTVLEDYFSLGRSYVFQKATGGIENAEEVCLAKSQLELIREAFIKYRDQLKIRNLEDRLFYDHKETMRIIDLLDLKIHSLHSKTGPEFQDEQIVCRSLRTYLSEKISTAKESARLIDEEFADTV